MLAQTITRANPNTVLSRTRLSICPFIKGCLFVKKLTAYLYARVAFYAISWAVFTLMLVVALLLWDADCVRINAAAADAHCVVRRCCDVRQPLLCVDRLIDIDVPKSAVGASRAGN